MQPEEIMIEVYDKHEGVTSSFYVVKLSNDIFRMMENDVFNYRLTYGTEFEIKINKKGVHEVIRIIKDSTFITRRFLLTKQFATSEYKLLGDEIERSGGFWQVDFGGFTTINLPRECKLDIDKIFEIFDYKPTEIIE